MTDTSIPQGSMKMISEEAWNHFCDESNFTVGASLGVVRATFEKAVEHALNHALEEGIVAPGWQMDPSTEGSLAFLADQLSNPEHITSPTTWVVLAHEVVTNQTSEAAQELAQKVLEGKR